MVNRVLFQQTQRINTMVKTVKFLAVSLLLVPSFALAMAPSMRDVGHGVAGALEGFAQDYCGHKAAGFKLASADVAGAVAAAKGYAGESALSAIAAGRIHNEVVGPMVNSYVTPGQSTAVTMRDNTVRTLGNLLYHAYNNGGKIDSSLAFKSIDPFFAVRAMQALWANKASIMSMASAEEAQAQAYINAATASAPAAASKAKK